MRILLCGIAAAIVGFLIGLVTPKQYDAVVQVLVAPYSPVGSPVTSEADASVKDILDASAPRTVSTQVEMLTGYGVIGQAAEKVATDMNLPYKQPGDELNPFDLQDKITVVAAKESDVVTLRVRMSQPDLAAKVAGAMYVAFEDQNEQQSKDAANRAIDFLKSQVALIQTQLHSIEDEAAKAKEDAGASNIDQQVIAEISQLRDLQIQRDTAQGELEASTARAADLRQQLAGIPSRTDGGTSKSENPIYTKLKSQLMDAIAARESLLVRYLEDSEQVRSQDKVISGIQQRLKETPQYSYNIESSSQPNPTSLTLKQELAVSEASAKGAAGRVTTLQAAVDKVKQDMGRLPKIQEQLQDLQRQQLVLERISELYTTKLKTLEVAGSFRRSATHLITPAVAIPRPAVPNFGLNVGLGLFLGLAVGFLWSIGTEAKRNPIRSLGQLNRLSLQPCYRVIPELRVPMRGLNRAPAEYFDSLLVNFVRSEKKGYKLGVLGVTRGAGATTTAMNLAIAAARGGYTVLYVEVDPGNSALTKLTPSAGDVKSPGANISIYNASLGETLAGGTVGLPSDLEVAASGKDLVIFDFAPVKASGDAFLLANQLDEMVLLVRANATKSVDFLQAQQALIDAGCPLVSVTLTRIQDQSDDVSALEQQAIDVKSIPSAQA
ncbi:MAG TPA: hypothetical protein VHE55_13380 [Fimbriimonadaceae bacterium]|nr:hypothetical protein [Fimbriimonadaceae bacterium]